MKVKIDGWAWLDTAGVSPEQMKWLTDKLTLVQIVSDEYRNRVTPAVLELYKKDEANGRLGVPREFFFDKISKDHEVTYDVSYGAEWPDKADPVALPDGSMPKWAEGRSANPKDLTLYDVEHSRPVTLRDEQANCVSTMCSHLERRPAAGGIIQAPTAWGKTVMALSLIRELKLKAVVLVHRKFLMDQWMDRIANFLPDAKVGIIYGKKWKVEGCHIVLAMIETLASWAKNGTVRKELKDEFGIVVTDETHRCPSPTWSTTIPLIHAAKRVGISARPRRSDGLDRVLWYHIGPKVFEGKELRLSPKIRRVWSSFSISNARFNSGFMSKEFVAKLMGKSRVYNADIIAQATLALKAGRKVFVFSDSLEHLQNLKTGLDAVKDAGPINIDFFIGGRSKKDLDIASEKADILLCTYQMCKEALDIPRMDTAILATPIRNPEQTCVAPNTMIWNGECGLTTAENISAGDMLVAGAGGDFGKVTKVWKRECDEEIVRISPMYLDDLHLTSNHPVLVREYDRRTPSKTKCYRGIKEVPAGDIILQKKKGNVSGVAIGLPIISEIKAIGEMNVARARILGYYLAEGNTNRATRVNKRTDAEIARNKRVAMGAQVYFSFGAHETELVNDVVSLVAQEFNANSKVRYEGSVAKVVVYSTAMAGFISRYITGLAKSKKLSSGLMCMPLDLQEQFIETAHLGDGCITKVKSGTTYWRYATSSHVLALQIQMILLRFGKISGVSMSTHEHDEARFSKGPMWEVTHSLGKRVFGMISDGYLWANIKSISRENYSGPVYNFSVSPQEHYATAGGLVHNCGRILRPCQGKKDPIVVDMRCDNIPICRDYAETRDKFYAKLYGDTYLTNATMHLPLDKKAVGK